MSIGPHPPIPPAEPLLEAHEIQGNIVPGFLKPYMALCALRITDTPSAKRWLGRVTPMLTTLAQAMESRQQVRQHRGFRNTAGSVLNPIPSGVDDAWTNLGLSYDGMARLLGGRDAVGGFTDEAFVAGLAARSGIIGDPTDPESAGAPINWKVGGPDNPADVLAIFAADRPEELEKLLQDTVADATSSGLAEIYCEHGQKLDPRGREHFGFKDGVSQPGVRGRYAEGQDAFVTPRTIAPDALPEAWLYGLPGQYLVWPGEFIFGYPGQGADPLLAGPPVLAGPAWARNGSYLVFRRLTQDVSGFQAFVAEAASSLATLPHFADVTPARLAAYLIGRWPSGAPLARSPRQDNPDLGADRLENNFFEYATATLPLPLASGGRTDKFAAAQADPLGQICPMAAHIRKVNTRSTPNDLGGRRASFARRILRRGLPFGAPFSTDGSPESAPGERGLLFLSYQASIVDQFELLTTWMGDPTNPRSPSGHDVAIGENGQPGDNRQRIATILAEGGAAANVCATRQFVTPTGGGYFFSPSISALAELFAT